MGLLFLPYGRIQICLSRKLLYGAAICAYYLQERPLLGGICEGVQGSLVQQRKNFGLLLVPVTSKCSPAIDALFNALQAS